MPFTPPSYQHPLFWPFPTSYSWCCVKWTLKVGRSHLRRSPCDLLLRLASLASLNLVERTLSVQSFRRPPCLRCAPVKWSVEKLSGQTPPPPPHFSSLFHLSLNFHFLGFRAPTNNTVRRGRPSASGASSAKANHVYYNELRSETHRSMPYSCPLGRTYS